MELADCECPCECPLVMDICNGELMEPNDDNPICIEPSVRLKEPNVSRKLLDSLDSCVNNECYSKQTERYI